MTVESGMPEDVAATNMAKLAAFEDIAVLLEIDSDPTVVLERVKTMFDNAEQLAADLVEASALLAGARQTRKTLFALSTRLMAQLSWCVGYLAGDEQQLPDDVKATIDEAVATLPMIDEEASG